MKVLKVIFIILFLGACANRAVDLKKNNLPKSDGLVKPTSTPPYYDPTKVDDKKEKSVKEKTSSL